MINTYPLLSSIFTTAVPVVRIGYFYTCFFLLFFAVNQTTRAQKKETNPLTHYFNREQTHYIKFSGYAQLWARYTEHNPGSKINESLVKRNADLSIRRLRAKMTLKPFDDFVFYVQGGTTNFNELSEGETSFTLLDVYGEYQPSKYINVGAGRTNWKGLTRFSAGPYATLLYDVPLMSIANVNVTDKTLRNFSVYAKGQIGKLDYKAVISKPSLTSSSPLAQQATINNLAPNPNLSAYVKYEFFEMEQNATSTSAGSYLGRKKVLALGIGAEFQKNTTWYLNGQDTLLSNMRIFTADLFYDTPLNKEKGTSFNFYAAAFRHDYGPNYIRQFGVNNVANGVDASTGSFNGAGNSYPLVGTGNSFVFQSGFTLPYFNRRKKTTRLMPAAGIQYSNFDKLDAPMITYDLGLSLLLNGHDSKFVFNAQSRPIYNEVADQLKVTQRKMMYVIMYHINIK
jgi:hypothetical protein